MDPVTIAMAGAGLIKGFMDQAAAKKQSQQALQAQQQNLADALYAARDTQNQRMSMAGSLRQDQFGNATYYDPTQGRWVTYYTPTQQRLIDEGQARQSRANIRGTQASQDYDTLRAQYLYRQPKSEDQSYAEILNLINQATGQGDQALNTIMNRFKMRTTGNLPELYQADTGPSYTQQLAETMLKARSAALDESLKRKAGHQSEFLPAMKQFEGTANFIEPLDPTGGSIVAMGEQGRKDQQGALGDFEKLVAQIYGQGGQGMNTASALGVKAATSGPQTGDFLKIAAALKGKDTKTGKTDSSGGTLGGTTGATYSGDDGISGTGTSSGAGPFGFVGGSNANADLYGDAAYQNVSPDYWGTF